MPWNILQPITFFPWKPLPQSSPSPLPESPFVQAIWRWHNHSDCQLRNIFYTHEHSCSCNLVPFLAPWDLAGTSASSSLCENSSALHFLTPKETVPRSTVSAQPQLGTWHLHMSTPGCPSQHNSALNWRELVLRSWGEAAGTRAAMAERQWHTWQWPTSATPLALQASIAAGLTQWCPLDICRQLLVHVAGGTRLPGNVFFQ